MKGNLPKKKFKIRETTRFCKGNDAYRGEIFGGQQPVRHGEINSGGLDSFLSRFFFYHDHTNRCCCCCCSIVVVVVLIAFQRSDGKIFDSSFDGNGSSSSSS